MKINSFLEDTSEFVDQSSDTCVSYIWKWFN